MEGMAAMTSFCSEKCCQLVIAYAASACRPLRLPAAQCQFCLQFLIHSTFVIVEKAKTQVLIDYYVI